MTKKYLFLPLAVVALVVGSVSIASASNNNLGCEAIKHKFGFGKEEMIKNKAEILGMNQEELKLELENGKSYCDIAEEKDISCQQIKEEMKEMRLERLEQLVADGTITQEEADEKIKRMEERQSNKGTHSHQH